MTTVSDCSCYDKGETCMPLMSEDTQLQNAKNIPSSKFTQNHISLQVKGVHTDLPANSSLFDPLMEI